MALDSVKEQIKKEYVKCAASPAYFMKKYVKIQHPLRGTIPFALYPFQEDVLEDFKAYNKSIVLKSRQLGISTLIAGYILWLMTFYSDKNVLVIATKQDTAKNLVTKVRFANEALPSWLKVPEVENNRLSLKLKNGSQVKAVSSASDSARSEALSLLVVDECAFIDGIEDIWISAQSTLSTGGQAILLSTPNGIGNFFHQTWVGAESGENGFHTIKLKWDVHPERDQAWREDQTRLLGKHGAAQECDADFISSGNTVVEAETLQWYKDNMSKDPIEKRGVEHAYWLWEYPDYSKQYCVIADVGRGDSSDFSAFHIFDLVRLEQVAEFRSKMPTKDYGRLLVSVATEWNNALLIVENNNVGWATIDEIISLGYQNLFYSSTDLLYVDVESQITNKIHSNEKKMTPGFTTSPRNRPLIISKLENYIRTKAVTLRSIRLIDELFTFVWVNGRAEAARGYNDDLVMSLGVMLWVRDTAMRLQNESTELAKATLGSISRTTQNLATVPIYQQKNLQSDPWVMPMGVSGRSPMSEDLRWLIDRQK
jgi:hypothetical protein